MRAITIAVNNPFVPNKDVSIVYSAVKVHNINADIEITAAVSEFTLTS